MMPQYTLRSVSFVLFALLPWTSRAQNANCSSRTYCLQCISDGLCGWCGRFNTCLDVKTVACSAGVGCACQYWYYEAVDPNHLEPEWFARSWRGNVRRTPTVCCAQLQTCETCKMNKCSFCNKCSDGSCSLPEHTDMNSCKQNNGSWTGVCSDCPTLSGCSVPHGQADCGPPIVP
mmetsp:Transcript_851/g.1851  ORF Transcript_851/g.1851 Transcript_851/m.1851 type:complete len:175 (+) Transcript_851:73-597(+)